MGKGRKLTTSLSDRLLGSYSFGHVQVHDTFAHASVEFAEDDVWSAANGEDDRPPHHFSRGDWSPLSGYASSDDGSSNRRLAGDNNGHVGGLSLALGCPDQTASSRVLHQFKGHDSGASPRGHLVATSAPVSVPDWGKIYRLDSVGSTHEPDDGLEGGGGGEIVPPHEYLARAHSRGRRAAANSVFEGVGRTLKGRDMSRIRDAVWSQTGFDG